MYKVGLIAELRNLDYDFNLFSSPGFQSLTQRQKLLGPAKFLPHNMGFQLIVSYYEFLFYTEQESAIWI